MRGKADGIFKTISYTIKHKKEEIKEKNNEETVLLQ